MICFGTHTPGTICGLANLLLINPRAEYKPWETYPSAFDFVCRINHYQTRKSLKPFRVLMQHVDTQAGPLEHLYCIFLRANHRKCIAERLYFDPIERYHRHRIAYYLRFFFDTSYGEAEESVMGRPALAMVIEYSITL